MKGPEAFRTISEAAEELGVAQHVLRFWETKFSFIRPMKRAGGRRFYRPQDLDVLRAVRALLHDEGYTIKGVQKLHKEQGMKRVLQALPAASAAQIQTPAETLEPIPSLSPPPVQTSPLAEPSLFDPPSLFERGGREISPEERARLQDALDGLLAARARLERLIGGA
ncbi:MAG TPA: MerR family transcriptional regulator [Caulobacteraceae bacterium]|nr:MerR family transcriptional regulator [Caulobacteraceae bacterium]